MDISGRTVWQQASGDTDRDYSDLCLKLGVILNGPGYAGPWPDCKGAREALLVMSPEWEGINITQEAESCLLRRQENEKRGA